MRLDTKQTIDIISALAVVASLLFVGFQLVLDRRVAQASQVHSRTEFQYDLHRSYLENSELVSFEVKRLELQEPGWWSSELQTFLDSGVSIEEIVIMRHWLLMLAYTHNNNYYQYRQGLLNESGWQSSLQVIEATMSSPAQASIWLSAGALSPEFLELIRDL